MPPLENRLHRNLVYLLLFILMSIIIACGTVGYRLTENYTWLDSLYMTLITISTVGMGEINPLSANGRILTIFLIVFGVGIVAVSVTRFVEELMRKQISRVIWGRNMEKTINSMRDHTIICGFGFMGQKIATELVTKKEDVIVIERDPETTNLVPPGIPVVPGDASSEEALSDAGISRAKAVIGCLSSDADNLFLTVTARGMNSGTRIIVRIAEERNRRKFIQAGASDVVAPLTAGAREVVNLLTQPSVLQFLDLFSSKSNVQVQLKRIAVNESSSFVDQKLSGDGIRRKIGGMVIVILREENETIFDPGPDTTIKKGDTLFVIKKPETDENS